MSLLTTILAFGAMLTRAKIIDPADRSNDELDLAIIITDLKLENEQLKGRIADIVAERKDQGEIIANMRAARVEQGAVIARQHDRIAAIIAAGGDQGEAIYALKQNIGRLEVRLSDAYRYVEAVNTDRAVLNDRILELEGNQPEDLPGTQQVSAQLAADINAFRARVPPGGAAVFGPAAAQQMQANAGNQLSFEHFCNCVPARHDMFLPRI
jgi:hypothetical protein